MNVHRPSRRVVLKGLGATVALPWLESMHATASAAAPAEAGEEKGKSPKRFAFLFFGDGIHPAEWWAKGNGSALELGPAFASLEPFKQQLNIVHGLRHPGGVCDGHARGAAGILSGIHPHGGREIRAAASLDQVLAKRIGDATALPSLVLACERPVSGYHESGYSMMYASHVSWSSPVAPVPAELYPSLAFDSLFESKGNRAHASVLDHVLEQLNDVSHKASRSDQAKIDEYASSVREVEGRLKRLQADDKDAASDAIKAQRPDNGLPTQLDEHARLMCDIVALAFQTDRTRIATMLLTNNLSGQVYPFLGLRDDHHSFSHSWQNKEFASITRFWIDQYAYLVKKLASSQEGDGTVLDHSCIMLANEQWTAHSAERVPLLMAGSLDGAWQTGRSLDFEQNSNRKFSSLLMTLARHMGLSLDQFGDSTSALEV
ncbi:MAG: DUF1552 domain-containing protein [Pirellulales bacterium]